jgi:large subunit ribosomal protein L28e
MLQEARINRMSASLVWELVKGHNSAMRKGLHKGQVFSAEAGNLYNKHSFKYSGLANSKSVDVSVDAAGSVKVSYGSVKNASTPRKAKATYTVKRNARRALVGLGKQVASFRPDLKVVI